MTPPLPLAAAAERLRGRPGRPRRGTGEARAATATRVNGGLESSGQDSQSGRPALPPRLLDVAGTALYLSISADSVRELDASGVLSPARVRIPAGSGRTLSRVLFDRAEIDRLVAGWRTPACRLDGPGKV
jgi:hypothetical protein